MTTSRLGVVMAMTAGVGIGCRPPAPTPSYNRDLGSDGEVLLPTPAAWHSKDVVNGSAEWRPFRKPSLSAEREGAAEAGVRSASPDAATGPEKEILETVAEFNRLIAEEKYTEALEFLVEEHAAICEQALGDIAAFAEKIRELGEAAPACKDDVDRLLPLLTVPKFLPFQVVELKVSGERAAVGKVANPQTGEAPSAESFTVTFSRDAEGYWFIESGHIGILREMLSAMQTATEGLSAFLGGIKSGEVAGDDLEARSEAMNELMRKLYRLLAGGAAEPDSGANG